MSPTNCIQSAAKRTHSSSCRRNLSDSDTAHLSKTPTADHCTAARVLSVAYATEIKRDACFAHIQASAPTPELIGNGAVLCRHRRRRGPS
jgi:hypothetical protein